MWVQVTQHYLPMKLTFMQMDDRWVQYISAHWIIALRSSTVPLASIEAIRTRSPPSNNVSHMHEVHLSFLSLLFLVPQRMERYE